jgi:tetratricopeptide (TPR) repeat protein
MSSSSDNTPFEPSFETKRDPLILPQVAFQGDLLAALQAKRSREWAKAWRLACLAIEERPFHPEGWILLSEIAATVGNRSLARRCAKKAVALTPNWEPAQRQLSAISVEQDNPTLLLPDPPLREGLPPRLSVCLIAKNEERFLDGCLLSVRGLADQIVLVDTGSTDRTVEIAQAHGVEVYFQAWNDDFSAARNASLMHARGDWILILDADEEVKQGQHAALKDLLYDDCVIAYRLPLINIGLEDLGFSYVPRLFRNAPFHFFVSRIHEQIYASVEYNRERWLMDNRFSDAQIVHYGYQPDVVVNRNKMERNLRLLEQANRENPAEVNLIMNLGLELWRSGQHEAGLNHYRQAHEEMLKRPYLQTPPELREALITQFASLLIVEKQFSDIVNIFSDDSIRTSDRTATHYFMLGLAHSGLKEWEACAKSMRLCLDLRDQRTLSPIHRDIRSGIPAHCMANALRKMGKNKEAILGYTQALHDDPSNDSARIDFAFFLIEERQVILALSVLEESVRANPSKEIIWEKGAQIALNHRETICFALDWTLESLSDFTNNANLRLLHAEALMINGKSKEGLVFLRDTEISLNVSLSSGVIMCSILADAPVIAPPNSTEPAISRAFLQRYRKAIDLGLSEMVRCLNERLDVLSSALPTAAYLLNHALNEAKQKN